MPSDTCPYVLRAEIANPPGSTAPGQRDHDEVAHVEVVRAADDAASGRAAVGVGGVVLRADVDAAPADRLAVLVLLLVARAAPGPRRADPAGRRRAR